MLKKIISNKIFQFTLVLIIGVAIGAIFYPTKHIKEELEQQYTEKIQIMKDQHEKTVSDLTEKINQTEQEKKELIVESEKKVSTLTSQITVLKSQMKENYYKIVKPDGTIIEKKMTETNIDESTQIVTEIKEEFNTKITQIENKWKEIHTERIEKIQKEFDAKETEYKDTIAKLKKETEIIINPRNFGVAVGYLHTKNFYINASYDVFGPIFIDLHTSTNFKSEYAIGGGVGLRF